jgi:hypothetical protein
VIMLDNVLFGCCFCLVRATICNGTKRVEIANGMFSGGYDNNIVIIYLMGLIRMNSVL